MTDQVTLLGLETIVFRYASKGQVVAPNGSIFICPLDGGPLRFLHKLYQVENARRRRELEALFGFALAQDYIEFMSICNGATLFDNSLSIYGLVSEFTRSPYLEDQQAISVIQELESSRYRHGSECPWKPIGAVSGFDVLLEMKVNRLGQSSIQLHEEVLRVFSSFRDMVCSLAYFLDTMSNEHGLLDEYRGILDMQLLKFLRLE